MDLKVTIEIWQKDRWYVARCPELDFVSQGLTQSEARRNLMELIQIQFEEMTELGTLEDYLLECDYARENGTLVSQSEMVSFERSAVQVV
jgi:predicted RNase H-like HicB family nuclease